MTVIDAILLGGGTGRRFAASSIPKEMGVPKQFQILGNTPVFIHCLKSLLSMDCLRQILLVVPEPQFKLAEEQLHTYLPKQMGTTIRLIVGGSRRQDSSRIALEALEDLSPLPSRVLIHDGCRPYLSREFLGRIKDRLFDRSYGAWVPVVPVIETLKRIENQQVVTTIDRSEVHRVQTPQIFEYTVIRSLVQKTKELADPEFTDDASLCEYYGIPVGVFEGDVRNLKLTYDFEMDALRSVLEPIKKNAPTLNPLKDGICEPESDTIYTA